MNNHPDEEEPVNEPAEDICLNVQPIANVIEYRFYDEIGEPRKYINLIRRLGAASENDLVNLHFICDGGRIDAMQGIITAIRRTRAHVVGHLDSHAASAASIIFLSCKAWNLSKESYMMFHDFNGGLFGKGHEMNSQLKHYIDNFRVVMDEICFPFFSKPEISSICSGQDKWIGSEEIIRRLNVLNKHREKLRNPKK